MINVISEKSFSKVNYSKNDAIYFSHPIGTYNTVLEDACLKEIAAKFPNCEIINPNSIEHKTKSKLQHKYFENLVKDSCAIVVALPFPDGVFSAGVYRDILAAHNNGLKVYQFNLGEFDLLTAKIIENLGIEESAKRSKAIKKRLFRIETDFKILNFKNIYGELLEEDQGW